MYIYFVSYPCLLVEEYLYKRFKCFKNLNDFFLFQFKEMGAQCTLMHVYVWNT